MKCPITQCNTAIYLNGLCQRHHDFCGTASNKIQNNLGFFGVYVLVRLSLSITNKNIFKFLEKIDSP